MTWKSVVRQMDGKAPATPRRKARRFRSRQQCRCHAAAPRFRTRRRLPAARLERNVCVPRKHNLQRRLHTPSNPWPWRPAFLMQCLHAANIPMVAPPRVWLDPHESSRSDATYGSGLAFDIFGRALCIEALVPLPRPRSRTRSLPRGGPGPLLLARDCPKPLPTTLCDDFLVV